MYLLDTNIISELRKRERANPGLTRFFGQITDREEISYLRGCLESINKH